MFRAAKRQAAAFLFDWLNCDVPTDLYEIIYPKKNRAMALCVAIFDKEDTILFLKVKEKGMNSDLSMQVQRFLHNSYDIILDKINYPPAKTNQDLYLGTLLLSTSFRSHGYLTNTSAKFMLVTDAENSMLKDHEIRLFFKKLHTKYCNAISNPFYELGSSVKSRHIDKAVHEFFECF